MNCIPKCAPRHQTCHPDSFKAHRLRLVFNEGKLQQILSVTCETNEMIRETKLKSSPALHLQLAVKGK